MKAVEVSVVVSPSSKIGGSNVILRENVSSALDSNQNTILVGGTSVRGKEQQDQSILSNQAKAE